MPKVAVSGFTRQEKDRVMVMFSVAMPTYKRLQCLKRAIDDVLKQTYRNWELIISDDETGNGETWQYLQEISKKDNRIRIYKNSGPRHGQIWNVNNALRHCKGDWVKPFFDDDRLLPNCLEGFAKYISSHSDLAMIGCRAQHWLNGAFVSEDKDFNRHPFEMISSGVTARKAMCMYDSWNCRTPTYVAIRGDIIQSGCLMVEDDRFKYPLDVRWFGRILERGGVGFLSDVLVIECQGEVESGTSDFWKNEHSLTEELRYVYAEIYNRAKERGETDDWPSLYTIDAQICGIRGLYHITKRQWKNGFEYLLKALMVPRSWPLIIRWLKCKLRPGFYPATKRETDCKEEEK